MKRIVSSMMLTLLLISLLSFHIESVKASGTVYIRASGLIDPSTANITTSDYVAYTFTGNIYDEIVVERDNIIIDGADYTVQGTGAYGSRGIDLTGRTNVTVKNTQVKAFEYGIYLYVSSGNSISGNNLTDNYWNGIAVYGSNNIIVGNNITENNDFGIGLLNSSNNRISENNFANNYGGIGLGHSSNNSISGNNMTNNDDGISFWYSSNNSIYQNSIADSDDGIYLDDSSSNNRLYENIITNNYYGILLYYSSSDSSLYQNNIVANNNGGVWLSSSNNIIYHNNFVNNTQQVYDYAWDNPDVSPSINVWDDGYPSGGNYWSNYTGVDSDHDGIGDSEHIIYGENIDHYPLMGMFSSFDATLEYLVQTICNSTISNFQFNGTAINFNVSGQYGTLGFCRICIPKALMDSVYRVFVNGTEISPSPEPLPCSNSTHNYLYFTYELSTKQITIIPEFPSLLIPTLFMITTLSAVIAYKRRKHSLLTA